MRRAITLLAAVGCGDGGGTNTPDAPADPGGCESAAGWTSAPAMMRGPTQETAAVALDGKIYVLGGFDGQRAIIPSVQVFDTAACAWSEGPALWQAVHHATVAEAGGTIYILGALEETSFRAIGDVWAWNPATETAWSPRAFMPAGTARGSAVAGTIGGKIYVAGGFRGTAVTDVSVYDPGADSWSPLPPLPMARDHACGGVIDGKLYVAGGRQTTIGSTSPIVFEFTPGGAWVQRAPMITARGGTACGVVNNRLIVVGGEGNPASTSGVFPQVESYDAAANAWQALAPMVTPRHGMGAAAWNGRLYVPGGANVQAFGAVATHEILTP